MIIKVLSKRCKIGPFLDVFASEDQGLTCIQNKKPSPKWQVLHGYVQAMELRNWHVNLQNSHQSLKERIVFFVNGGTAVAKAQPNCASGGGWLSSHHQCTGNTHRNRMKFTLVKDVGVQLATAIKIRTSKKFDLWRIHEDSKIGAAFPRR